MRFAREAASAFSDTAAPPANDATACTHLARPVQPLRSAADCWALPEVERSDDGGGTRAGPARGPAVGRRGALLLERMAALGTICLRRLGGGRAGEVRFGRLLANPKVTPERLVEGWAGPTAAATAERTHVLAVQDTSELCFRTTPERRRSLGEVGKGGRVRGLL